MKENSATLGLIDPENGANWIVNARSVAFPFRVDAMSLSDKAKLIRFKKRRAAALKSWRRRRLQLAKSRKSQRTEAP